MISKIASKFAGYCLEDVPTSSDEFLITAYGTECLISDTLQVLLLIIFGVVFGTLPELAMFSICFTSIKKRIGGYHASSHFACIISYTSVSVGVSLFITYCFFGAFLFPTVTLHLLAALLIFCLPPLPHKNMPRSQEVTEKQWHKGKSAAIVLSLMILLIYFILPSVSIAGCYGLICSVVSRLIPNREEG